MTMTPVANTSVLAEFTGGTQTDIAMMIGVGVVKDSDAVFFQYLGDEQTPRALTLPTSGKPVFNLNNVRLTGIDIAEDIGSFNATKLNLFIESSAGNTVLVTSGLQTLWSQCIITALMGLYDTYSLDIPFTLNSWKGQSGMKPCFASIKVGRERVSDNAMYEQLKDLRADGNQKRLLQVMRESVDILKSTLNGGPVDTVEVAVEANNEDF